MERKLGVCVLVWQEDLGSHTSVATGQTGCCWLLAVGLLQPGTLVARRPTVQAVIIQECGLPRLGGEELGDMTREPMLSSEFSRSQAVEFCQAGKCPCLCPG